jgi:hypothetical protein
MNSSTDNSCIWCGHLQKVLQLQFSTRVLNY